MKDIKPYAEDGIQSARTLYKQMDTLVKENLPPMTKVNEKIADYKFNLYPPHWISKNTKLCWRWDYPEYHSNGRNYNNCPTNKKHDQCAPLNNMTLHYLYMNQPKGCDYRWKIMSSQYDPWFANVKLCFRHVLSTDRSKPCSPYRLNRDSCQPLGMFTPHLFAINGKNCFLQWKILMPSNAPLWASKLKFCMKSTRCHVHKFRKTHCVSYNEWTSEFFIGFFSNNGVCDMQWGIYMV